MPGNLKERSLGHGGFTLVELLVVVAVVGVLVGITVGIINPSYFQKIAKDSVRKSTLEKIAQGIEAYSVAEGGYPAAKTTSGVSTYVTWPTGSPAYTYSSDGSTFCVYVPLATTPTSYYKYYSETAQTDGIKECTDVSSCDAC